MRIYDRIATSPSATVAARFQKVGIDIRHTGTMSAQIVLIDHDDPRWAKALEVVHEFDVPYMTFTDFSNHELMTASYLDVEPEWHHGYPQPEEEYRHLTYDSSDYCRECGTGLRQVAPFYMRKEPVWGRRSIMQLNWVFEEYFVRTEAYHQVFQPFDIPCRPVLKYKSGAELLTVVQLDIRQSVELVMEDRPYRTCSSCHRKKYVRANPGYYPKPSTNVEEAIFRSEEWFGSGHSSANRIMISHKLYAQIVKCGLKGATFKACAP